MDNNNSDVQAENSDTGELESNSEFDWRESDWISKIRSGLSGRYTGGGYVPIKKLPDFLRRPVRLYTPQHWHFGLHHRHPPTFSSESEFLKINLAAACKLNPDEWDKFCDDVVDDPADLVLKSYGLYGSLTEVVAKEVQYVLTLDALTLVLVLSSLSRLPDSVPNQAQVCWLPNLFIEALVFGGLNIEALVKRGVASFTLGDDLLLCENQIPMALLKKVISKCYSLLPEERKSNYVPDLRELENPDSNLTKELLDMILKIVTFFTCRRLFAEPFADKESLENLYNANYKLAKLENCAHIFACIHKVMTSYVEVPSTVGTGPIPVTTTFAHAKQLFFSAVATGSKQIAGVIATMFGFSRKTVTGGIFSLVSLQSATVLKKAGLQIKGIPGMVRQVAFKNGCLFLPIMSQSGMLQSHISNMAAYEMWNTSAPFPFMDYLLLMSQLIKTPEDVSYLIDCGVIRANFGTQQCFYQTWESINVRYPAYSKEYSENMVNPINTHCASALNVMITDFYNTFCSKPWLVISVISAIILLVATLIQTYILVIGSDKMQPHFP